MAIVNLRTRALTDEPPVLNRAMQVCRAVLVVFAAFEQGLLTLTQAIESPPSAGG